MVLVPIALIVFVMSLLLQYTTTVRRRRAQVGGLITFLLIYASTNVGPIAAAIRVGNDYQRAAPGEEAIRLIPFLQLDTRLILTSWTLDQLLIGFTAVLPVLIIFQQRLRTTFWIVFAAVAVGVEINEGWANMSGITPPFRIDIHDVALRGLGALAATALVYRSRQALIDRDLRRKRASAPAAFPRATLASASSTAISAIASASRFTYAAPPARTSPPRTAKSHFFRMINLPRLTTHLRRFNMVSI